MLKNKFKLFVIVFTILTFLCTFAYATDTATNDDTAVVTSEQTDNSENTSTEDNTEESTSDSVAEDDISYGDIYKFEDNIVIEGVIDGNVFAFGNNVTIKENTVIGGDLFVFASKLDVQKSAVYGNIFVFGNDVTINAEAYDLYAACNTLNVGYYSVFHRGIKATANTINMNGIVLKDANFACSTLNIESDCVIYENLNYTSNSEATIPEGSVQGEVNYSKEKEISSDTIWSYVISLITTLVFTLVVWLLISKLAPNYNKKLSTVTPKKLLVGFGIGLLALIVTPIVSILLMCTVVGITLGFALLAVYFLILCISFTIAVISISYLLKEKIGKGKSILYILLVTLVLWVLSLIPYAGSIIEFIIMIIGFGIFLSAIFSKKDKVEEITKVEE